MNKKNMLFICSRNQWRSPTAEAIWNKDPRVNVRSAGTSKSAKRMVTEKDVMWADIIFVMEKKHRQRLYQKFPHTLNETHIVVLDIPDIYEYMDAELIDVFKQAIPHYINDV